jgi:hypothetical protein
MNGQEYLMMTNNELRLKSAGIVIKKFIVKKYREKKREQKELQAVIKI